MLTKSRRKIALDSIRRHRSKTKIYVYMRNMKCPKCSEEMIAPAELSIDSNGITVSVTGDPGCDSCDNKFENQILDNCVPDGDVLWSALCQTEALDTMAHVFADCASNLEKTELLKEFKKYICQSE
jgi:transcription elongation factor Elf1